MITFDVESGPYTKVIGLSLFLVPLNVDGKVPTRRTVQERSLCDYLVQGSHDCTESSVDNLQLNGSIIVNSIAGAFVPSPLPGFPNQGYFRKSDGSTVTGQMGLALQGDVHYQISSICQAWVLYSSGDGFTAIMLQYGASNPKFCSAYQKIVYSNFRWTSATSFLYDSDSYLANSVTTQIDLSKATYDQVVGAVPKGTPYHSSSRNKSGTAHLLYRDVEPPTELALQEMARDLYTSHMYLHSEVVFPLHDYDYGELAMSAAKNARAIKVNMLEFLGDWENPLELARQLSNLSKLKTLEGLSDDYLTLHYGILPTIGDINSLIKSAVNYRQGLKLNQLQFEHASRTQTLTDSDYSYRLDQHCKLAIAQWDNQFLRLLRGVNSFGVLPTFRRIWDLIPFSFVIDWLIDVGKFIGDTEFSVTHDMLNIRYATWSRKSVVTFKKLTSSGTFPVNVNLDLVHYRRWTSDQCPVPTLSLPEVQNDFNHWLESSALFIQRTHK